MKGKRKDPEAADVNELTQATILVVEDDEGLNHLIQKTLQRAGFQTEGTTNGVDAISKVAENPYIVLLLDYWLEDMTAKQLVEMLARRMRRVPFIVITGRGDQRIAVEMMKLGARDYIVKEPDFVELLPQVMGQMLNDLILLDMLKEKDEALRKSEERIRDVALCSSDWIWEVDASYKYTFASGRVKDILGYEPEELIGKRPFDLMSEKEAQRVGDIFKKIASKKQPITDLENWNLTKNGKEVCLLTNGVPMLDDKGRLIGYRGVDKDITRRKRMEEERENLIGELQDALEKIKTLRGLIPICAECKKIRDDQGYWNLVENYIEAHSEAEFSHSICPDCMKRLYPKHYEKKFGHLRPAKPIMIEARETQKP